MDDVEVAVVGAGVAGLRCAALLHAAGRDVVVLEASDGAGGRIRTDRVDGFLLDRGFQVVNPAYNALRAAVDVSALELQPFPAGARVLADGGTHTLADPFRAFRLAGASALSALPRPAELWALGKWAAPLLTGLQKEHGLPRHLLQGRPDASLRVSLDRAGAHGLLRATLERYLAGVVLEDEGETSAAFALLLVRSFVRGTPGLPRSGMQALPDALAAPLAGRIRYGEKVDRLERSDAGARIRTAGSTISADRVVVATDPWAAESLLGRSRLAAPTPKGLVTDWYTVDEAPEETGILHLDVRAERGPAVNACVVSAAAPSYAPHGRHLVQATSLLPASSEPALEHEVRRHTAAMLGAPEAGLSLLRRDVVPHALPVQPAPLRFRSPQRIDEVTLVCGDHRDTASSQGALVSGARAAHAVLASLSAVGDRP
ncbi:NAD(P)/FAD-dependent oxidoreductase [Nocardioides sp. BP30]|uniref:NAD(P)/FAD-dependent oxidoreductase n=1 Tax=Nocardioides sp. BP30 TaxID=3036374 RepID=UPI00246835F2|nr:NAD(P)/FAD-dependent oxidoreductase [Nocardioides sp. BP30]WGL53284.1 NAD(P)/FAD-dependent oxidoreductase [Nocardioides sp. BP30]